MRIVIDKAYKETMRGR